MMPTTNPQSLQQLQQIKPPAATLNPLIITSNHSRRSCVLNLSDDLKKKVEQKNIQKLQISDLNKFLKMKGGAINKNNPSPTNNIFDNLIQMKPVPKSALSMTAAMCLHFFGYEFARSSNLALFTSSKTGFTGVAALPIAMTFVSPFSFCLLWFYGKKLEQNGPKVALRITSLFCMTGMCLFAGFMSFIDYFISHQNNMFLSKVIVWSSFVFQNSYAHLLYTQHWSFIGSVLDKKQGARWFASIAGATSIASTIGASGASQLTTVLRLPGLMLVTALALCASTFFAERAYVLSEKHGFEPVKEKSKKDKHSDTEQSTLKKGLDLFKRVPILGVLFCEVLSFQSLSMLLNVSFVRMVKKTIENDALRAAWTAKFYALINGTSGTLQFFILPFVMQHINPIWIWRIMPIVLFFVSLSTVIMKTPSLLVVSSTFFLAKMMDYSFRGVANEMVYVPLDFDSRFLGKEIIGVFANRFGKSGISIFLSILTSLFGDMDISQLSLLSTIASSIWLTFSLKVSNMISDTKATTTNAKPENEKNRKKKE